MSGLCTFCDEPLDDSLEHILLSAIGGRKKSRQVICGKHNGAFGSTIDKTLTEQLSLYSNLFAIRTGRNQAAATIRDLVTSDGTRIDLEPGGRFVPRPQYSEREIAPGQYEIQTSASSLEHARDMMSTYLAKFGKDADEIKNVTLHESISPSGQLSVTQHLGGDDACRALAKMSLLLLAAELGTDAVRGRDTLPVRSFVTNGGDAAEHVRFDFATPYPLPGPIAMLPPHAHWLAVFASAQTGEAMGVVELFGTFRFAVLLSERWIGPSATIFYGVDPITGKHAEVRGLTPSALDAAGFRTLTTDDDALAQRRQRLDQMVEQRRLQVGLELIVGDVWTELVAPELVGTPMTPEFATRFAEEVASRFAAAHLGQPYSKQLDPRVLIRTAAAAEKRGRRRRRMR